MFTIFKLRLGASIGRFVRWLVCRSVSRKKNESQYLSWYRSDLNQIWNLSSVVSGGDNISLTICLCRPTCGWVWPIQFGAKSDKLDECISQQCCMLHASCNIYNVQYAICYFIYMAQIKVNCPPPLFHGTSFFGSVWWRGILIFLKLDNNGYAQNLDVCSHLCIEK